MGKVGESMLKYPHVTWTLMRFNQDDRLSLEPTEVEERHDAQFL